MLIYSIVTVSARRHSENTRSILGRAQRNAHSVLWCRGFTCNYLVNASQSWLHAEEGEHMFCLRYSLSHFTRSHGLQQNDLHKSTLSIWPGLEHIMPSNLCSLMKAQLTARQHTIIKPGQSEEPWLNARHSLYVDVGES